MLQQTQVRTVIPYFERFTTRFPTVKSLAEASLDDVLSLWSGLGYYRRARHLRAAAGQIVKDHGGEVPDTLEELMSLPGIGRSTAGAILASGFNQPGVILDGNVKRVLARFHLVDGELHRSPVLKKLWEFAELHTPAERCADYAQAIMDLGATCCTKSTPSCRSCPVHSRCAAYQHDIVASYPMRNMRKPSRRETLKFLLAVDSSGRTLLQRQAEDSLWGGLWLPPRIEEGTRLADLIQFGGISGDRVHREGTIVPFIHTLSHIRFHVEATVVYLTSSPRMNPSRDDLLWYDTNAPSALGLSRLTVALLEKIEK